VNATYLNYWHAAQNLSDMYCAYASKREEILELEQTDDMEATEIMAALNELGADDNLTAPRERVQ
jgi:hypothetical protein